MIFAATGLMTILILLLGTGGGGNSRFVSTNKVSSVPPNIVEIEREAIPEPSTVAGLMVGLIFLAVVKRKSKS